MATAEFFTTFLNDISAHALSHLLVDIQATLEHPERHIFAEVLPTPSMPTTVRVLNAALLLTPFGPRLIVQGRAQCWLTATSIKF